MFWGRYEAMFNSSITTYLVLVSSGMEKANIQRLTSFFYFWKEDLINMFFTIIVIMTVAGNTALDYPLIFLIPFIDREHEKFFAYTPGIR